MKSSELAISACRGEYGAVAFVIRANQKILNLTATPTDLSGERSAIPANAIDIRIVKCWFQAGIKVEENNKRILTPELLLKDDKLVVADIQEKHNYLRIKGCSELHAQLFNQPYLLISGLDSANMKNIQPIDADALQPVDIDAGTNKQFWVTLRVPENAIPDQYTGKIKLSAMNAPLAEIIFYLNILPFNLEKPCLRYSIYYTGRLSKDGKSSIGSNWKSSQQYYAEMADLKSHGIDYPTTYQDNEQLLEQELEIRKRAGLFNDALYTLGVQTGNPIAPTKLEALKNKANRWLEIARKYGYTEVYFYGIDEARGDRLRSQRPAWKAIHDAGGKIFAACSEKGTFETMGDLLDLAVWHGAPDRQEAKKFHKIGHQIFCYSNPQVGVEEPETYRRNFGILLWKAGYDGAMDFAYQYAMGHIWNDFDHKKYRDLVFAYPTINGVIDTIQWEGFREGVNDIRYLTTLINHIKKVGPNKKESAAKATAWVEKIDPNTDLDLMRTQTIDWILKLQ